MYFSCQWWRACRWKKSNERRMSLNKRQDGMDGYIITSTILSLLFPSHFFLFSSCFGTNRFICHIGHSTQSTGWLLKVVYWGWPCLTFNAIDYSAIHQRNCKPGRGSAWYKPRLRKKKSWGRKKRRSSHNNGSKVWNSSEAGPSSLLEIVVMLVISVKKLIRVSKFRHKLAYMYGSSAGTEVLAITCIT